MNVLELAPDDIDAAVLSLAQRNAFDGVLAKAMAGYLRWLAPRIDDLRRTLPERQRALRDEFVRQGQHKTHAGKAVEAEMLAYEALRIRFKLR